MKTMKITRRRLPALAALCLSMTLGLAWSDTLDTIRQRKKVLIAVDIGAPPFGYLDAQARQAGSDVEAAQLLAQDLGVALEIIPVTGPNRVQFLLSGKADMVMASFSITPERSKVIGFSQPYGAVAIAVAGPRAAALTGVAGLAGKNVAVTRGTTSDQELARATRGVPGLTITRYEDDATTNTAVATGQQDYLAGAPSVIAQLHKAHPARDIELKFEIASFPYAVGLRKDDAALKRWVDAWVATHLKSGRLGEIYQRHLGQPLPPAIAAPAVQAAQAR